MLDLVVGRAGKVDLTGVVALDLELALNGSGQGSGMVGGVIWMGM